MPAGDPRKPNRRTDPPEYTVYRSRRRLSDLVRKPDLGGLRDRIRGRGRDGDKPPAKPSLEGERPAWRRVAKWVLIAAGAWILISIFAFAISAQIQKGKLADSASKQLDGNPLLLVSPQTILVLGTDVRSGAFAGPSEAESKNCLEAIGSGRPNDNNCDHGPYRSDTIMLIRAGAGTFRKLSIPRDTLAEVGEFGSEKINSAYAFGGAKLAIRTVENLLGIDVDQVAIIDFDGFRRFIDSIGGITVDLPTRVCSSVSGGAFNLNLKKGEHELDGFQAITLARTRNNECGKDPNRGTDIERAQFQQLVLDGIKRKLTSIRSLPMNFIKGPFIAWNAPKAMVSSMGMLTLPQLAIAAAIGGGDSEVLKPSGQTEAGNLIISPEECARAAEWLLGKEPPREPNCPQA